MKVSNEVKTKKVQQLSDLYNLVIKKMEDNKEQIYSKIKNLSRENKEEVKDKVIDIIYKSLEEAMTVTLKELKKIYKNLNNSNIEIRDLIYNKDNKTLEERVEYWFDNIDVNNTMNLFYHMCLILDTETFQIINQTIKNKVSSSYVEIIGSRECDHLCSEYCDGEVHKEEDIEFPPYHPGCQCQVIYYEEEDIIEDI